MAALPKDVQFEDELIRQHDRRLWCGFITVALLAVLLTADKLIHTFQAPPPPYVVLLNSKGEVVDIAHPVRGTQDLYDAMIRQELMEFVRNAKTITNNIPEEKERLNTAFAFTRGQGAQALRAYYFDGKHWPWDLYLKIWTEVKILREPLKLGAPNSWRVDWSETVHDYHNADQIETTNWSAEITVAIAKPGKTDTLRNPAGLVIQTLAWAPEVQ